MTTAHPGPFDLRRSPPPRTAGYTWDVAWQYIGSYVADYQDATRANLGYPGYALFAASFGYQRIWPQRRGLRVSAGWRNALNHDLLAGNARLGAGREFLISANLMF